MTEKRAIRLGWDEVCEIVAKEIEALFGLQIKCGVNPVGIGYTVGAR